MYPLDLMMGIPLVLWSYLLDYSVGMEIGPFPAHHCGQGLSCKAAGSVPGSQPLGDAILKTIAAEYL